MSSERDAVPPPLPGVEPWAAVPAPRPRYLLSATLFLLTLFTTTTLGAGFYLSTRTDVTSYLSIFLVPSTVAAVWNDGALLATGLSFSLPLLCILLCHELGHYLACRHYRIPASLPYFLPAPLFLGTFGAFIRIRGLIRGRRELLDVGVAGPLAGFVALLPFLLFGIARSTVGVVDLAPDFGATRFQLLVPGKNLLVAIATLLFHGPLPEGTTLDFHPFALAAWVGLMATALNLLPLGQLDGGHILYAVIGRHQRQLAWPLWLGLATAAIWWPGWLVVCALVLLVGLRHPPLLDERRSLGGKRRLMAILGLVLLAISFIPVPLEVVPVFVDAPLPEGVH